MEAKDLRVGNFLQDKEGRLCRVLIVDIEFDDEDDFFAPSINYGVTSRPNLPIPITSEWLIRFGFNKTGTSYTIKTQGFNRFEVDINDGIKVFVGGVGVCGFSGSGTISYIHQLQNLHYVLTGIELTLKD